MVSSFADKLMMLIVLYPKCARKFPLIFYSPHISIVSICLMKLAAGPGFCVLTYLQFFDGGWIASLQNGGQLPLKPCPED
ncbi:MAG: hypothetical protein QGH75_11870 [Pseudomonadales bacterium]|jgi:hypothetical protein|nr:hypothetical protein [Pseudomonadales bacterium]|tara:strand:- start:100 stop:339 length:240 start_codon:yes stop_codon:yes gene_type:complete